MALPGNSSQRQPTVELSLHTPGNSRHLEFIRTTVGVLARKSGFSDGAVAQIEMAVDEACSNIIQHAYAPQTKWCRQHRNPEIRLYGRVANDQLIIEINDHGQTFDFVAQDRDQLDERLLAMRTRGYGISIIRRLMDEVHYSSCAVNGNTLRLVKSLPKSQPAVVAAPC